MQLAKRMMQLESSAIRRLFELGLQMKNPIDLSLGQPDFDVPDKVKQAAKEAIDRGQNRYAPTAGIPELRRGLTQNLRTEGLHNTENVMVTSGASGGLFLAIMTLADDTCDVYVPDPYFIVYPQIIRLSGATMVPVSTYPDFRLTPEKLGAATQGRDPSRRKILLINSPCNPTGIAYREEEVQALAKKAKELGFQVISDEVYDSFYFDHSHTSWLKFDPNAVLVRAFSKTGGMPGWRIGYATAPEPILSQMLKLQQFTFVCINTPAQWACLKLLDFDYTNVRNNYRARRDLLMKLLTPRFKINKPEGSFFAFPAYPISDGALFMKTCIENEILVVPGGGAFSQQDTNFRISFSASPETLERGAKALIQIADKVASPRLTSSPV